METAATMSALFGNAQGKKVLRVNNFAVYYIEANIVCILVFGILLLFNRFNIDRQEKQIKFDHVLIAFMLYFLTDCFWAALVGEYIPKTRFSVVLNSFFLYIFMCSTVYFWLQYAMSYEHVPYRNRPRTQFYVLFPFIVSTIALIVHYIIAPQTLINDKLETLPIFSIYISVVPDIYMATILFYTIQRARKEENPSVKRKHLFIGFFPLIASVNGLIETVFFPHVPIYCFTCLIMMLVFYIQSIMDQVSLDPLTGLNNRGQLVRYTSQKSNLRQEGRQTVVIMMDVDNFKGINDTLGHAEGDKALVAIANSMKKAMNSRSMPSFLGRYGGDEFIMIVHPFAERRAESGFRSWSEETDLLLQEIREDAGKHGLAISAGYDEWQGEGDSIESCIQRADKKLYQEKKEKNVGR